MCHYVCLISFHGYHHSSLPALLGCCSLKFACEDVQFGRYTLRSFWTMCHRQQYQSCRQANECPVFMPPLCATGNQNTAFQQLWKELKSWTNSWSWDHSCGDKQYCMRSRCMNKGTARSLLLTNIGPQDSQVHRPSSCGRGLVVMCHLKDITRLGSSTWGSYTDTYVPTRHYPHAIYIIRIPTWHYPHAIYIIEQIRTQSLLNMTSMMLNSRGCTSPEGLIFDLESKDETSGMHGQAVSWKDQ